MNFREEIFKSVQTMVDRAVMNCKVDRTYESVIKKIAPKGYVVVDRTGSDRTVPCCIPGLELRPLQRVWVQEPMGDLKKLYICGVMENTNNSSKSRRRRQ